ncbi:MAG: cation:dicarboxylate symporter family transporter, partial [Hyphomicrobiales bacterium]
MASEKKMSLTIKVLLGMAIGIVVGLVINLSGMNAEGSFVNWFVVDGVLYAIGKMFVNALKMLVVPLVFFSLICGVCGIGDI